MALPWWRETWHPASSSCGTGDRNSTSLSLGLLIATRTDPTLPAQPYSLSVDFHVFLFSQKNTYYVIPRTQLNNKQHVSGLGDKTVKKPWKWLLPNEANGYIWWGCEKFSLSWPTWWLPGHLLHNYLPICFIYLFNFLFWTISNIPQRGHNSMIKPQLQQLYTFLLFLCHIYMPPNLGEHETFKANSRCCTIWPANASLCTDIS